MTKIIKITTMAILSMVWITCCQIMLALIMFTQRQNGLSLFGHIFVWDKTSSFSLALVAAIALLSLALVCWFARPQCIAYVPSMVIASIVLILVMAGVYDHFMDHTAIGTVQSSIESDLTQQDLALYGELGFYGGLLEQSESGERAYYVCGAVNNYGPFSYQPFAGDIPLGEERFAETTAGELCSITERRYADGYWVCVKRFQRTEDVAIDVEHLDDLRPAIQQTRFENHRGVTTDVAQIFQALEAELGDIIQ